MAFLGVTDVMAVKALLGVKAPVGVITVLVVIMGVMAALSFKTVLVVNAILAAPYIVEDLGVIMVVGDNAAGL